MRRNGNGHHGADWFKYHDAWYQGIDRSMDMMMGSAQRISPQDMIRAQNRAIRDCWRTVGGYMRQAMVAVSESSGVYPQELKADEECRTILRNKGIVL